MSSGVYIGGGTAKFGTVTGLRAGRHQTRISHFDILQQSSLGRSRHISCKISINSLKFSQSVITVFTLIDANLGLLHILNIKCCSRFAVLILTLDIVINLSQ